MFVTDVWDDIREMTSGYFAGDEALYDPQGNRAHKQQSPIQLLITFLCFKNPVRNSKTTLSSPRQIPGMLYLIRFRVREQR